jgi:hypothetical protein
MDFLFECGCHLLGQDLDIVSGYARREATDQRESNCIEFGGLSLIELRLRDRSRRRRSRRFRRSSSRLRSRRRSRRCGLLYRGPTEVQTPAGQGSR